MLEGIVEEVRALRELVDGDAPCFDKAPFP